MEEDEDAYEASGDGSFDVCRNSEAGSSLAMGGRTDPSTTQRRKRRPRIRACAAIGHEPVEATAGASLVMGDGSGTFPNNPTTDERYLSTDEGGGHRSKITMNCAVCGDEALGFVLFD